MQGGGKLKRIDLTGRKFGKLTAKEYLGDKKYLCRCDCGKTTEAYSYNLKRGITKSCGCLRAYDLTGLKFGRLTAQMRVGKDKNNNAVWQCICECGKVVNVPTKSLMDNNTKSCGCLNHAPRPTPKDCFAGTKAGALNDTIPSNNTSGIKGVSWSKQKQKWEAYIKFQGKQYRLGFYDDINDAADARKKAERETHDDFLAYWNLLQAIKKEL